MHGPNDEDSGKQLHTLKNGQDCLGMRRERMARPYINRRGLCETKLDPPGINWTYEDSPETTDRDWPKSGQTPETCVACNKHEPELSWNELDPGQPSEKQATPGPNNKKSGNKLHTL